MWPFYKACAPDDGYMTAMRMLFTGTEQGYQLKNLAKTLNVRDIFAEQISPIDKAFRSDYLAMALEI